MAKLPDYYPEDRHCPTHGLVTVSQHSESVQKRRLNGSYYWTTEWAWRGSCGCKTSDQFIHTGNQTPKETTVTKEFDTTATKSTALNAIQQRVGELERALYNKVHALAKVEAEHNKLIADANNALSNVMAQAYQNGIEEEDLELHLPDHVEELSERLIDVTNSMSLANVLETV